MSPLTVEPVGSAMAGDVPGRPPGAPREIATSLIAGFSVMDVEIAAGRLFAPYYGTSTTTWAFLIGTVLLSLTAGNLLGGHLSRRDPNGAWVGRLLLAAAVFLALFPRVAPHFMAGSLVRFKAGDATGLVVGAASGALLLAIPVACLGALAPLLLQGAGRRAGRSLAAELGRLGGRLAASSAIGSLLGTFAAGLVFIPWLGTTRTIDLGATALAATALVCGASKPLRRRLVPAAGLVALLASWPRGAAPASDGRLVYSTESLYNHITVVDRGLERQLRVNDGFAVQSFVYRDGRLPLRDVWAFYAAAPAWAARPVERVLLLGAGGGTAAHLYRRLYPDVRLTAVELDPEMVRVGQEQLGIDLAGVEVVIEDARTFVATAARERRGAYDLILLDAFQFPYVPFQLTTREFFRDVDACLAPGGVLVVNAGRYGEERAMVHALARTMGSVFDHVGSADVANRSNTILVGSRHGPEWAMGAGGLRVAPREAATFMRTTRGLPAFAPATWPAATPVLTDDHAPVEWLTDRIVWASL